MKTPTLTALRRMAAKRWGVDARGVSVHADYAPPWHIGQANWYAAAHYDGPRGLFRIGGRSCATERGALLALARELRK